MRSVIGINLVAEKQTEMVGTRSKVEVVKVEQGNEGQRRRSRRLSSRNSNGSEESVKVETVMKESRPRTSERKRKSDETSLAKVKKEKRVKTEGSVKKVSEKTEKAVPSYLTDLFENHEWVPGKTDIRARAMKLCRIMGELYRLRWRDNDRFKMIHWRKVGKFLQDFPEPIVSVEEVQNLVNYSGIGPSTISVLEHIQETGYLDYLDDLYAQVEVIHEFDDRRLEQLAEIGQRVEQIHVNHEHRRAVLRQRAREMFEEEGPRPHSRSGIKACELMEQGTVITGLQRRKMIESSSVSGKEEVVQHKTRSARKRQRVDEAVIAAAEACDSCAICLEEYTDEENLQVFACKHCFHQECMQQWLLARIMNAIEPSCPLCRRPIAKN